MTYDQAQQRNALAQAVRNGGLQVANASDRYMPAQNAQAASSGSGPGLTLARVFRRVLGLPEAPEADSQARATADQRAAERARLQAQLGEPAPQGRMVGPFYVAPSIGDTIAHSLGSVLANRRLSALDAQDAEDERSVQDVMQRAVAAPKSEDMIGILASRPETLPSAFSMRQSALQADQEAQAQKDKLEVAQRLRGQGQEQEYGLRTALENLKLGNAKELAKYREGLKPVVTQDDSSGTSALPHSDQVRRTSSRRLVPLGGRGGPMVGYDSVEGTFFDALTQEAITTPAQLTASAERAKQAGLVDTGITPVLAGQSSFYGTLGQDAAQAAASLPGLERKTATATAQIDSLISNKDLDKAVGTGKFSAPYLFGLLAEPISGTTAADVEAELRQVESVAFLSAYDALRNAGAITEKETTSAINALFAMSRSQSVEQFRKQLARFKTVLLNGLEVQRRRANPAALQLQSPATAPAATPDAASSLDFDAL